MREIKFRAFLQEYHDNGENGMFYDVWLIKDDLFISLDRDEKYDVIGLEDVELMQNTGLKDKNGVEVYEGDIVEATRYDGLAVTGVVGFRDCSFVINTGYQTIYTWIDYQIEVIGNVYNNKELLEESEE